MPFKSRRSKTSKTASAKNASSKKLSILGTSDEERQQVATKATERRIGDAIDKTVQDSFKAHNAISYANLRNKTPMDQARNVRIAMAFGVNVGPFKTPEEAQSLSATPVAGLGNKKPKSQADKDAQRKFRNEQRNIGRDIKATEKMMKKVDKGSFEYINLSSHLESLQSLQRLMRRGNKVDGSMRYNAASVRMEAYAEYVTNFKGKSAREAARTQTRKVRPFVSEQMMKDRVANKMGVEIPEAIDAHMEDLERQLSEAAKRYDSAEMTRIIHEMIDYRSNMLYKSSERDGVQAATMRSRNFE